MKNIMHSISMAVTLLQFSTMCAPDLLIRTNSLPPSSPNSEKKLIRTDSLPPKILTDSKNPWLHEQVSRNNICNVKNYLQHRHNPNQLNDLGITALHVAAQKNHLAMTWLLLQHHANPNMTDNLPLWQCTALHWAVMKQNTGVVKLLLKHRTTDRTIKDATGHTALDIAKYHGFDEIISLLEK